MTIFTSAAVLALVTTCGGVPADSDLVPHFVATVMTESAGDQYAIGINPDPDRNLPAGRVTSTTAGEAIDKANALIAQGRHIDLGLAQISDRQLARHHLTVATALADECANLRAGAEHLADDYAWTLAHRRYNSGTTEGGIAYSQHVMARINSAISIASGGAPSAPDPSCDGWHVSNRCHVSIDDWHIHKGNPQ